MRKKLDYGTSRSINMYFKLSITLNHRLIFIYSTFWWEWWEVCGAFSRLGWRPGFRVMWASVSGASLKRRGSLADP